ncbi:MAG: DUF3883 domain-containing protein [Gemmataceae bacterium]
MATEPPDRLQTEALVLGYAMSRLDDRYRQTRKVTTWKEAFQEVAECLGVKATSIKLLRDEFDPWHANTRTGWQRPIKPSRQRILDDLKDVGDEALMALVDRILARDEEATREATAALVPGPRAAQAVAERLLTGQRAERYFMEHVDSLLGYDTARLLDLRSQGCGFDFGIDGEERIAIEVKGIKQLAGNILFTDREWREGQLRRTDYHLVVVGNLAMTPQAKVIRDPTGTLNATSSLQATVATVWRSSVSVAT